MGKLADKFGSAQNLGTGDINYYKEEVKRLKRLAVQEIDMELIDLIENVRREYNQQSIEELAKSIEEYTLLAPVQVIQNGSRYKLLAGYRRYFAHKFLNRETIKAIICNLDEKDIPVLQLVENIQREELSPHDLELSVQAFVDEGYSYEKVAQILKKSKSWVSKILSSKQIREKNIELLQKHQVDQQVSPSILSVLAGLPEDDTTSILQTLLEGKQPITQAVVKREKKQLLQAKLPQQQGILTVKIIEKENRLTASVKESGTLELMHAENRKDKIISLLQSLGIEIQC